VSTNLDAPADDTEAVAGMFPGRSRICQCGSRVVTELSVRLPYTPQDMHTGAALTKTARAGNIAAAGGDAGWAVRGGGRRRWR
jgi:hypothetical protein